MKLESPFNDSDTHRSLRLFEVVALLGTAVPLAITRTLLGISAVERNPFAAHLIETVGWHAVGVGAIAGVALSFHFCRALARGFDRRLGVGLGAAVASVSALNALNDVAILARVGVPENLAPGTEPFLGFLAVLTVFTAARPELLELARRGLTVAKPNRQVVAVGFAVLVAVSIVGPGVVMLPGVDSDHNGTAAAATQDNEIVAVGDNSNVLRGLYKSNGTEAWRNSYGSSIDGLAGDSSYIYMVAGSDFRKIDKTDGSTVESYTLASGGLGVDVGPNGDYVYVGVNGVQKFHTSNLTKDSGTSLSDKGKVVAGPNGDNVYVMLYDSGRSAAYVYQVDAASMSVGSEYSGVDDGGYNGGIDVSPDGKTVYAGIAETAALNASDLSEKWINSHGEIVEGLTAGTEGSSIHVATRLPEIREVSASDGSVSGWSYTSFGSEYPKGAALSKDGAELYAPDSGGTTHAISTSDGSLNYDNTDSTNFLTSVGVTGSTEPPKETVTGLVTDSDGNPVANATVITLEYNTGDPDIDESALDELKNLRENPAPQNWTDQLEKAGYGESSLNVEDADINDRVALMHTPDQWAIDGAASFPVGWSVIGPDSDLSPPKTVVDENTDAVFSCWEPLGALDFPDTFEDNIAGMETVPCELTVERLDEFGNTQNTVETSTSPKVEVTSLSSLGTKEHEAVQMDLAPGFYRVTPENGQSTTYAVAPNGDITQLQGQIEAMLDDQVNARTQLHKEIREQYDAGNIGQQRTTTNATGHYSIDVNAEVVDEVTLMAVKGGEAGNPDSVQGVETLYENTVRSNFLDEAPDSVDGFSDVNSGELKRYCSRMDSVVEEQGTPFTGTADAQPPDHNAHIQGEYVIPRGVSEQARMCLGYNMLEDMRNDPLNLFPGFTGDFSDLSDDEILTYARRVLNLLNANPALGDDASEQLGMELPENSEDLTNVEDAKVILDEGSSVIESPGGDTGYGDTGSSFPGSSPDSPVVDDPTGSGDDVAETISRSWPVTGVGDWDSAAVLLRIVYSDGTEEVLSTDSEYVSVEERATGADRVHLEEYPFNSNDGAIAKLSLDVATEDGIGGDESHAKNPTFDGTIPGLNAVTLSKTTPGKNETVTVGVDPAESTEFGDLKRVNVSGPNCDRALQPSGDETEFGTCGAGTHRIELTFSNANGYEFTEVVNVEASVASQDRPPAIKSGSGATGRFAVVGNGFESGRIESSDGVSKVELVGVLPSNADTPNHVTASTTGFDTSGVTTTTVRLVKGDDEKTVRERVGIVLHTDRVDEDALMWRNGRPIRNPGEHITATVEHRAVSTSVDTFTSETGEVSIKVSRDPGYLERATHYLGLRFPRLPVAAVGGAGALLATIPLGGLVLAARGVKR